MRPASWPDALIQPYSGHDSRQSLEIPNYGSYDEALGFERSQRMTVRRDVETVTLPTRPVRSGIVKRGGQAEPESPPVPCCRR